MRDEKRFALAIVLLFCLNALFETVLAQNTGAVIGAKVKAGDRSFGYRAAVALDDGKDPFAHRLHYQHALTDRLRLRVIGFQNNRGGDLRFRSVLLETHYQFVKNSTGWNSGVQLQGRLPDGNDGPGRFRIAWANSFEPAENWELRAVLLAAREFDDQAKDGVILETRTEATYALAGKTRFGAQMYNNYNTTAAFGDFEDQRHQLGPVIKGRIGGDVSYNLSALFGVSRRAPDADLRLFLTYSL